MHLRRTSAQEGLRGLWVDHDTMMVSMIEVLEHTQDPVGLVLETLTLSGAHVDVFSQDLCSKDTQED